MYLNGIICENNGEANIDIYIDQTFYY